MKVTFTVFEELVKLSLREDLDPSGDITTEATVPENKTAKLSIRSRNKGGIMSGSSFVTTVYKILDPSVKIEFLKENGESFDENSELVRLTGNARSLLVGERLFVNLLQRAVSIATLTSLFVKEIDGTNARIVETRKTSPGLRSLEKRAVLDGGGSNHRFNLSTGVLIKDNHIAIAGSIENAVLSAKRNLPYLTKLEVEVDSLEQLKRVLALGLDIVDAVLLDNFSVEGVKEALKIIDGRCMSEASGNMRLNTVREYAKTGVDYISVGSLTQAPDLIDLGLDYL